MKSCGFFLTLFFFALLFVDLNFLVPEAIGASVKKPGTLAELALYRGPDRQSLLEAGARKEGTLTWYTTGTVPTLVFPTIKAFNKKYADIKVEYFRSDTRDLYTRVTEEHRAGRHTFDLLDSQAPYLYEGQKIMQPFYSPELANFKAEALRKEPGASDIYWAGNWETCIIVMYNTNKISKADAPKTYQDLLDPKFKGKMTIPTTTTGIYWLGNLLTNQGEAFVDKIGKQDVRVQNISGGALGELVVSGEVPLTPATYASNATKSLAAGAPVGVVFLEPVGCALEGTMLSRNAPHPHAATLFLDFILSRESAEVREPNYVAPRKDRVAKGVVEGDFKKWYYSLVPDPIKTQKRWREVFTQKFVDRR